MQYVNLTPSLTPAYRFLSNHSNQLVLRTSVAKDPQLAPLYESWTCNQHILSLA